MSVRNRFLVSLLALAVLGLPSCAGTSYQKKISDTIMGQLNSDTDLSTLADLIKSAGVEDLLAGIQPMTLLAPSNDAFKALGKDTMNSLKDPANAEQLLGLLKNHVIQGSKGPDDLTGALTTVGDANLTFAGDGEELTVNGAKVSDSMQATNGWIHEVDQVLVPTP